MKIAVVGLGSIGMRHAKNLQAMGHTVQGYDPIPERRNQFPGALGEDAYVFATPTKQHYDDLLSFALRRPIFMEKPIAHKWHPSFQLVRMVGYNLRFHPCVIKAKEWLPGIGKLLWANFTCAQYTDKPPYLRDGVVLNWSHEIDLALYLLGPAEYRASSVRCQGGYDDVADIILAQDNCITSIHLDYITKPEMRFFTIYGEKGKIHCDLIQRAIFLYITGELSHGYTYPETSWDDDYVNEMKAFIDRIEGKDVPGCTGSEALDVLDICLKVRKEAGL